LITKLGRVITKQINDINVISFKKKLSNNKSTKNETILKILSILFSQIKYKKYVYKVKPKNQKNQRHIVEKLGCKYTYLYKINSITAKINKYFNGVKYNILKK
jgi:hypothetical protein